MQEALKNGKLRRYANNQFSRNESQRNKEFNRDFKRPAPKFLTTNDIDDVKNYDAGQILRLTLGNQGGIIELDTQDLRAFKQNIEFIESLYKKKGKKGVVSKGITAKQIIDASHPDDVDRANKQIYIAAPLSQKNGVVHFLTNAGPQSKVQNHHVHVEFLAFQNLKNTIGYTAQNAKNLLNFGRLKFECDCERHDFFGYRYIATIGGYGYGRPEHGYPKIRNELLVGVACKHVLRVMDYIRSPMGIAYISKQIEKARIKKTTKQDEERQYSTDVQIQDQLDQQGSPRTIKADHAAAERRMMRKSQEMAKKHWAKDLKELKKLTDKLSDVTDMQSKQLQARQQALGKGLSEQELVAVEAYITNMMAQRGKN